MGGGANRGDRGKHGYSRLQRWNAGRADRVARHEHDYFANRTGGNSDPDHADADPDRTGHGDAAGDTAERHPGYGIGHDSRPDAGHEHHRDAGHLAGRGHRHFEHAHPDDRRVGSGYESMSGGDGCAIGHNREHGRGDDAHSFVTIDHGSATASGDACTFAGRHSRVFRRAADNWRIERYLRPEFGHGDAFHHDTTAWSDQPPGFNASGSLISTIHTPGPKGPGYFCLRTASRGRPPPSRLTDEGRRFT